MYHLSLKQNISSVNSIPNLEKVILRANTSKPETLSNLSLALQVITGQFPKKNYAKRPLAGFKLKKDQLLGAQITLRKGKMHSFIKNLIFIILPKFVDFKGVPKKNLDTQGNIHFGLTQFFLWPQCEVSYEVFRRPSGFHLSLISKGDLKKKVMIYSYLGLPITEEEIEG
uniref:Ribosomal protein L5 n=1 Tax=Chloropicon laureae TaxID=464258 RepID=A0A4D6C4F7_9CHLO|nr:ribosomal protein L5 [Chloropicon laureae]QBX98571.1 ribosomal protein L5 [Chloropicon laureae]